MFRLNEDLFDDIVEIQVPDVMMDIPEVETTPAGPQQGVDTGIANELLTLINDENEAIRGYNIFKANLRGHEEFVKLIDDISNEEMNHIGMLQSMLKEVSPNAQTIEAGKEEADQELTEDYSQDYYNSTRDIRQRMIYNYQKVIKTLDECIEDFGGSFNTPTQSFTGKWTNKEIAACNLVINALQREIKELEYEPTQESWTENGYEDPLELALEDPGLDDNVYLPDDTKIDDSWL